MIGPDDAGPDDAGPDDVRKPTSGARRRSRTVIDSLVGAAISMPWPADRIDEQLLAWCRTAVSAEIVIEPLPAPPPDVSVVLADHRYLVARRRLEEPAFTDQERRLLAALVTMATTSRHAAKRESQLRRQALTDELTGLWHGSSFRELLEEVADERYLETIGVLFLDLDRFKLLNEQLGHLDADQVLREVGRRIRESLPEGSVVARTGGDEFAAVVRHLDGEEHLASIVSRLSAAISAPLPVADLLISVGVSVGARLSISQADVPERLLRDAERAMRRNKRARPQPDTPPRWYDERTALREMLDHGLVEVAYQPIVDLGTACVIGYEALVRGRHLEFGPVSPLVLVGAASRLRMLDELTEVVLGQAIETTASIATASGVPLMLSVNLEFEQLRAESALLQSLPDRLAGTDVHLVLEISERQVGRWTPTQVRAAGDLATAGVGLAVDDFGAGWSTLALLNSWAWEWVKIDRSLVAEGVGEPGRKLLGHVSRMLADLDLTAVAEGLERPEELVHVRDVGVQLVQGQLLGAPVSADAARAAVDLHGLRVPGLQLDA